MAVGGLLRAGMADQENWASVNAPAMQARGVVIPDDLPSVIRARFRVDPRVHLSVAAALAWRDVAWSTSASHIRVASARSKSLRMA